MELNEHTGRHRVPFCGGTEWDGGCRPRERPELM